MVMTKLDVFSGVDTKTGWKSFDLFKESLYK